MKTVCFVIIKHSALSEGSVNKIFIIISSFKVNDSIKQYKNCFYCTFENTKNNFRLHRYKKRIFT